MPNIPFIHSRRTDREDVIRAIERHRGPAIIAALGSDLYQRTRDARAAHGEVRRFDPFELAGVPSDSWSPLAACATWDSALGVAWRFAAVAEGEQRAVEHGEFWVILAEQWLAPLLFAAAAAGDDIQQVLTWAYGHAQRSVEATLRNLIAASQTNQTRADAHAALLSARQFSTHSPRLRASVQAAVQGLLRAYRFTRVQRSAASSDISPGWLLAGANTVYLIGDAKAARLLRPLMAALLEELVCALPDSGRTVLLAEADAPALGSLSPTTRHLAETGSLRSLSVPRSGDRLP